MGALGDLFNEFETGGVQAVAEPIQQPVQQPGKLGGMFAAFDKGEPEPTVDIAETEQLLPPDELPSLDFGGDVADPDDVPVNEFSRRDLTVSPKKRTFESKREGTELGSVRVDPTSDLFDKAAKKHLAEKAKPIQAQKYKGFFNELGRSFGRGALGVGAGIAGTAQSAQDFLNQGKFGGTLEDISESLRKKQKGIAPSKGGPKVRKFIANAVGETIPFMAATLGATLVAGPKAGFTVAFSVEGDNAYQDALESGATEEDAQMDRMIVGSINAALEKLQVDKLLGGSASSGKIIKEIAKAAREKAWKAVAKAGGKLGVETLKTSVTEGIQEALQETVSVLAPVARGGEAPDLKEAGKRIGSAALGGAVAGGFLGGAGGVIQSLGSQESDADGFKSVEFESTQDALDAAKQVAGEAKSGGFDVEIKTDGNTLSVKDVSEASKEDEQATELEASQERAIDKFEQETAQIDVDLARQAEIDEAEKTEASKAAPALTKEEQVSADFLESKGKTKEEAEKLARLSSKEFPEAQKEADALVEKKKPVPELEPVQKAAEVLQEETKSVSKPKKPVVAQKADLSKDELLTEFAEITAKFQKGGLSNEEFESLNERDAELRRFGRKEFGIKSMDTAAREFKIPTKPKRRIPTIEKAIEKAEKQLFDRTKAGRLVGGSAGAMNRDVENISRKIDVLKDELKNAQDFLKLEATPKVAKEKAKVDKKFEIREKIRLAQETKKQRFTKGQHSIKPGDLGTVPDSDIRPRVREKVDKIKKELIAKGKLVPISVDHDGHIVDGFHRYVALTELGVKNIPIWVGEQMGDAGRLKKVWPGIMLDIEIPAQPKPKAPSATPKVAKETTAEKPQKDVKKTAKPAPVAKKPDATPDVAKATPKVASKVTPETKQKQGKAKLPPEQTATENTPEIVKQVDEVISTDFTTKEVTSARQASIDEDREALGLKEINSQSRRGWEEALRLAKKQKVDRNADRIADQVNAQPEELGDVRTAGLVIRMTELKNEHRKAMEELGKLTDKADIKTKATEVARIRSEFDNLSEAVRDNGSEAGRTLAAQKLTLNKDFSLISVLNQAKANSGKKLSKKKEQALTNQVAKNDDLNRRIEVLEKEVNDLKANKLAKRGAKRFTTMTVSERNTSRKTLSTKLNQLLAEGCAN